MVSTLNLSRHTVIWVAGFEEEEKGKYDSFTASDDVELAVDKASASPLVSVSNSDTFIEQVVARIE